MDSDAAALAFARGERRRARWDSVALPFAGGSRRAGDTAALPFATGRRDWRAGTASPYLLRGGAGAVETPLPCLLRLGGGIGALGQRRLTFCGGAARLGQRRPTRGEPSRRDSVVLPWEGALSWYRKTRHGAVARILTVVKGFRFRS